MDEWSSRPAAGAPASYAQGYRWEGDDPEVLARAIEAAFDYRGDVTLLLRSGGELSGYLSNRNGAAPEPFLELFPAAGGPMRRLLYRELRGIAFTGRDTAAGKSWETWLKKYQAKKAAEARGEAVESLGLFPEPLE
jgi:hypothetical protein